MTRSVLAKTTLLHAISAFILACSFHSSAMATDDLTIAISDLSTLQEHGEQTHEIQLSIDGKDYSLQLWPSNTTRYIKNLRSRHFNGKVIGDENSWIRVSFLDNHLRGYIKAFGELIQVDTLDNKKNTKQTARKIDSTDLASRTSGVDRVLQAPPLNLSKPREASQLAHRALNSKDVTRIMPLSIVVDSRFDAYYDGQGLSRAINAIHSVDGLYQEQFGLAIQINSAVLLNEANDPFQSYSGNIEEVLRAFRNYSLDNKETYDNQTAVHLFSGTSDSDNIIGLSWINTACRTDGYNASVSRPFSEQMLLAAHELAHNLGAIHDNEKSCDIEYNQVMWPNISSATTSSFSDCSKAAVTPKLNASCNLDNVDIGISLELNRSKTFEKQTESLAITAHNTHSYRDATDINSATLLQEGITVSNLPEQCFQLADTVYCSHGNIKALASRRFDLNINYSTTETQIVKVHIDAPTTNDVSNSNNNAILDLNNPANNTSDDYSESTTPYIDSSSGGGAGTIGLRLILCLALMRLLRYHNTITTGEVLRPKRLLKLSISSKS